MPLLAPLRRASELDCLDAKPRDHTHFQSIYGSLVNSGIRGTPRLMRTAPLGLHHRWVHTCPRGTRATSPRSFTPVSATGRQSGHGGLRLRRPRRGWSRCAPGSEAAPPRGDKPTTTAGCVAPRAALFCRSPRAWDHLPAGSATRGRSPWWGSTSRRSTRSNSCLPAVPNAGGRCGEPRT